jgi:tetraacyldisaccharide 4'-kinase
LLLASATTTPATTPDVDRFDNLVSGRRRGPAAAALRGGLWLASLGYGLGVRLRDLAYSRGWKRAVRAAVPVVSVGNLTAGGTGKTPCVEYVAGYFSCRHDRRVCILSRGYGAEGGGGMNDEALVLGDNLPDVPHLQGADRAALAAVAVEELESEVLVLDDGFQHRRLARDLDLVLIDATRPFGYGHLLPRGLLREPTSSLRRAHAVVLTRCDQVSGGELQALRDRVPRLAPGVPVALSVHRPVSLVGAGCQACEVADLPRQVAAFCGVGNPEAFRRTLTDLGREVVAFRAYPDHYAYARPDVDALRAWGRSLAEGVAVVTTQKDMVKLRLGELGGRPLWALRVALAVTEGEAELHRLFDGVLGSHP